MGWQWHQLDRMQVICTSLQTDNHASTSSLKVLMGRMLCLPPNQQRQSTEGHRVDVNIDAIGTALFNVGGLFLQALASSKH